MKHFILSTLALCLCGVGLYFGQSHLPQFLTPTSSSPHSAPARASREIASSNYCFLCQFTPKSFPKAAQEKACTDLYGSICTPDNPYLNASAEQEEKSAESINKNRDHTARELGYKDFDDGLRARLQEAGIKINPNADPEAWAEARALLLSPSGSAESADRTYRLSGMAGELFADTQDCQQNTRYGPSSQARLNQLRRTVRTDYNRRRSALIPYYRNNIPDFMSNELSMRCDMLKQLEGTPAANRNPEWSKVCRDFPRIQREAAMLYREEGTANYNTRALNFLNTYFPKTPFYPPSQGDDDLVAESNSTLAAILEQERALNIQCTSHNMVISNAAQRVARDYASEVQRTRTHVESTISSVYSERRRRVADESLNLLRADIQSLIPQLTSDRTKQSKIIEEYNRLEMYWLTNPGNEAYEPGARRSVDRLRTSGDPNPGQPDPNNTASLFADPSLSHFQVQNAYYNPSYSQGGQRSPEQVNIYPGFLNLIDSNPYAFSSILAHELGHKIGPEISQINDHDMKPEFSELLACYKGRDSIRMQDHQADEVIADFVSSEVMAHQISKLPQAQRRSATMAIASTFCNGEHDPINCTGSHPENIFRVNGILASNPKIKEAMGCSSSQKNFKQCGISGLSLEGDSLEMSSEEPRASEPQHNRDAGGVQ